MRSLLLAVLVFLGLFSSAAALEPEQREVTVINGRVWDGFAYRETFVPSTLDRLTLIGGRDSAITFVQTLEYYWPLSRQVYVDFERRRDVVEGELVISHGGSELMRVPLDSFSILYPQGAVNGNGQLLWGDEAAESYAAYRQDELQLARDLASARQAQAVYERQVADAAAAGTSEATQAIVPPPPAPEPSLRLVTAPQPGFRIALEPGDYTMVLQHGAEEVSETQRHLRVVDVAGTDTLVADVIAEERWTRALRSNTRAARIYAKPGTQFYVTLFEASVFRNEDYVPVVSPQVEPEAGRSVWIRRREAATDHLEVTWGDAVPVLVPMGALKVDQTRGAGFGYVVRDARDDEAADLEAITIAVPSDAHTARGFLENSDDPNFTRQVIIVQPRSSGSGLVLGLAPLIVAFYLGVRKSGWFPLRKQ